MNPLFGQMQHPLLTAAGEQQTPANPLFQQMDVYGRPIQQQTAMPQQPQPQMRTMPEWGGRTEQQVLADDWAAFKTAAANQTGQLNQMPFVFDPMAGVPAGTTPMEHFYPPAAQDMTQFKNPLFESLAELGGLPAVTVDVDQSETETEAKKAKKKKADKKEPERKGIYGAQK